MLKPMPFFSSATFAEIADRVILGGGPGSDRSAKRSAKCQDFRPRPAQSFLAERSPRLPNRLERLAIASGRNRAGFGFAGRGLASLRGTASLCLASPGHAIRNLVVLCGVAIGLNAVVGLVAVALLSRLGIVSVLATAAVLKVGVHRSHLACAERMRAIGVHLVTTLAASDARICGQLIRRA